jgi:Na+/H+ antiporter NhaA
MSVFIANLAFANDEDLLASAKLAVVAGSAVAGASGLLFGRWLRRSQRRALLAIASEREASAQALHPRR